MFKMSIPFVLSIIKTFANFTVTISKVGTCEREENKINLGDYWYLLQLINK